MKCKYCQRERTCSARSHEENPFCNECLHERVEKAAAGRGPVEVVELEDGYVLVKEIKR
jgi:hypothetical protein